MKLIKDAKLTLINGCKAIAALLVLSSLLGLIARLCWVAFRLGWDVLPIG